MKFNRKRAYAREFGVLFDSMLPYLLPETIIMSAPTASSRIRQRGFDQALLIAESFAKKRQLQLRPLLYRATQVDQIGKNRQQRHKQMHDSLRLRKPEWIKGKTILLIDDVLTTGATLEAAATLLRKNGAAHVDSAVIARHRI